MDYSSVLYSKTEEQDFLREEESSELDRCINSCPAEKTNLFTFVLAMGNAADAVEIICVGYILSEMKDASTQNKEFLSAAVFIGMLFGGLLCGYLSDSIGRKPCLQYSLAVNAIAGLASAAAPDINWLIVFRVIGGIGIGGSVPSVFTLGAEIIPAPIRGKMLSVIACFWMVGALYTGLVGWIMLGDGGGGERIMPGVTWRAFALVCALPAICSLLLTTYLLPESPKHLASKGRFEEAALILSSFSGRVVTSDSISSVSGSSMATEGTLTFYDLFGPDLKFSTLIYCLIWYMLSFGTYGISTWINVLFENIGIGNVYLNSFIFAMANLPGNIFAIKYIEVMGRRKLLCYGMVLAAISALGFAVGTSLPSVVVVCACLFNAFSVAGWNALDCMSVENFPTGIRTTAMGTLAAAGRLGAISAQFVNGTLESNVALLLFVTSGCMMVGAIAALFTPRDAVGDDL